MDGIDQEEEIAKHHIYEDSLSKSHKLSDLFSTICAAQIVDLCKLATAAERAEGRSVGDTVVDRSEVGVSKRKEEKEAFRLTGYL